jgi:hypothetical protein
MADVVSIDKLAVTITQSIADYTADVAEAIERAVDDTAEALQDEIKANSPVLTGVYKKGWTRKKSKTGGSVTQVIYNKNKPQLTHLLEHGHAKKGGGRVDGRPHIGPATDMYLPSLERQIKKIIERGG